MSAAAITTAAAAGARSPVFGAPDLDAAVFVVAGAAAVVWTEVVTLAADAAVVVCVFGTVVTAGVSSAGASGSSSFSGTVYPDSMK